MIEVILGFTINDAADIILECQQTLQGIATYCLQVETFNLG